MPDLSFAGVESVKCGKLLRLEPLTCSQVSGPVTPEAWMRDMGALKPA